VTRRRTPAVAEALRPRGLEDPAIAAARAAVAAAKATTAARITSVTPANPFGHYSLGLQGKEVTEEEDKKK